MSTSFDYDLLVIGAGAAGLSAAGIGTNLGAKTLMVEREKLGGDCTWTGCVPSKTLLKSAKIAHLMRTASTYGLTDHEPDIDFRRVMEHVRTTREEVYHDADRPEIFEEMGVDVRKGTARFTDMHTLEIQGESGGTERVSGRYIVIASGGRPFVPPITGISSVPYLTSASLFELEQQPRRFGIVGAGPIGTEMAQAFSRLGSEVTVFDMEPRILSNDDRELADIMQSVLEGEGIRYMLGASVDEVSEADGVITVTATVGHETRTVELDGLLMATGRAANVDGMNLDLAGVEYTKKGITVDEHCRTNQKHIYAVGDATGRYQFTHMSGHMAKVAVTNAILKLPSAIDAQHVPWVTYAEPELAHVGATEDELKDNDTSYQTYRFPYSKLDRAITEHETTGLIKVHAKSWNGAILGVSILGARAGDLICEYALAMKNGVTLRNIADTIHPYPSYGEGVRRAADQWYVQKQSATFTRALQTVFGYRGPVIKRNPDEIV